MWSNGEDYNDEGEAVRLFQPILYGRKPSFDDPTCSYIGGASVLADAPRCACCHDALQQLVQLHVPGGFGSVAEDRTLQVFACTKAPCISSLFADGRQLAGGGGGLIVCRRLDPKSFGQGKARPMDHGVQELELAETKVDSPWTHEEEAVVDNRNHPVVAEDAENEWAVSADDEMDSSDLQALESKLSSMETGGRRPIQGLQSTVVHTKNRSEAINYREGVAHFPAYLLHSVQEPPVLPFGVHEYDVGLSGSDAKIQKMLDKYLAEEDDAEIVDVLRRSGTTSTPSAAGHRGAVQESVLTHDRVLLGFVDRLRRCPRQVLRYAYGGKPLWSIPIEVPLSLSSFNKRRDAGKKERITPTSGDGGGNETAPPYLIIPKCSCGAARVFEFQLLPSLLDVLEVDKGGDKNVAPYYYYNYYEGDGMNWGNIAVYTCPDKGRSSGGRTVCQSEFEYVVVQDSVDAKPVKLVSSAIGRGDVVIPESSRFDAADEDEDQQQDVQENWDEHDEDEAELERV